MTKPPKLPPSTTSLSSSWIDFAKSLASVLAKLNRDSYLCITVRNSARYIRFSLEWEFGMRLETTSNYFLEKAEQLNPQQVDSLIAAGWNAPNMNPDESDPDEEEDGMCPNYFVDFYVPVSFDSVANLAVRAIAEALGVTSPEQLEYFAFDENDEPLELPELGLQAEEFDEDDDDSEALARLLLLETIKATVGQSDLEFDEDGDIGIRFDTALIFAGVNLDGAFVTLFSLLLTNVHETPSLFKRLNNINSSEIMLRVYYRDDVIYAVADIPAMPFVSTHVAEAFGYFCDAANRIGTLLNSEFGGETAFESNSHSPVLH